MGSVISHEKCPRCGGVSVVDFDYNTLEESKMCNRCGKREGWNYVRDEDYNVIRNPDGTLQIEEENLAGYGVAAFQFDGMMVCYPLISNDDGAIEEFFDELKNNTQLIKEECYLTVWDDELQDVKCKYGTMPLSYDEMEAAEKEFFESEEKSS